MFGNTENNTAPASPSETNNIKQAKIKKVNPSLWFVQVEAQFEALKVKPDTTKYFTCHFGLGELSVATSS